RRYFNHTITLQSGEGFEAPAIEAVFKTILKHHDALRTTFKETDGQMIQTGSGTEQALTFRFVDLSRQAGQTDSFEREAQELQAGICLENGPLMKLGLFRLDAGDRLVIVIHHLVVDGVSWRILFEDFDNLYRLYQNGEPLVLPLKTDSFKQWSQKLHEPPGGTPSAILNERDYWSRFVSTPTPPLETDFPEETNFVKDTHTLSFHLDESHTAGLLSTVHEAFGTFIDDILLTALGLSLKQLFHNNLLSVTLESHGRNALPWAEAIDTSRTVGWFTSAYPVLLDFSFDTDLSRQIKEIKESLRRVPNNGIGFGILKYLTPRTETTPFDTIQAPISFNYLGQFDADVSTKSFNVMHSSLEPAKELQWTREHELDVSGMVLDNRLTMSIRYNGKRFKQQTIQSLSDAFEHQLLRIVSHCLSREEPEKTPAD
ncbi:MAG: non-ribosomal peptide synthetase, partial [bacterium]|nr:non-ribosomal peptide synthetase [bacterium]